VTFTLSADGGRALEAGTAANIGRPLAIVLDGKTISEPIIEGQIASEGHIVGSFTAEQAADLASILRSGSLPATVTVA
jgi:preprotein translocase subunit SecD